MNPIQNITVYDMVRRVRNGLVSLNPERTKAALDGGIITSEVGEYKVINFPQWDEPIAAFPLRKLRKNKFPDHVFGKMRLGDAFSAFLPQTIPLPPVGTTTLVQPQVTSQQFELINLYQTVRADAVYILHLPMPIGSAVTLRVFPPEIDNSTETKGIIWRPAEHTTVALLLPHSNDLAQILINNPRPGQSGLALKIELLDDNTTTNVETPLNLVVFQCTYNVWCTGIKPTVPFRNIPALQFNPVSIPTIIENMSDEAEIINPTEITGDGPTHNINTIDTPQEKINIPNETPAKHKQPKSRKVRNQQGMIASKWISYQLVSLPLSDTSWKTLLIRPQDIGGRGESLGLAYNRSVWAHGNKSIGYMTGLSIKFKVARSPAISGLIQVVDSNNTSSSYLVPFGENKDIPLQFSRFDSFLDFERPRDYNNEWIRTEQVYYSAQWRILVANRTAEQSDLEVELLVHPGEVSFDVSTKPRRITTVSEPLRNLIIKYIKNDNIKPSILNTSDEQSIVPLPALNSYEGNVEDLTFHEEDLVNDDFATEIFRGTIPVGTPVAFSLNLSAVEDESGAGGLSVLAEKFERFAHIIPEEAGPYGPEIGKLSVINRLPVTITGHMEFVAIPGDMNEDAAVRAFGLASILSLAGAGIKAIGGPNIANFLNAGMNVIKPITDIIGGKSHSPQEIESISTGIPISRFVQFLKPIVQNELEDPTFGSLLLQARDVIDFQGNPINEVPISIFAKLAKHAVERSLFDRSVTPTITMVKGVIVPRHRYPYIMDYFLSDPRSFARNSIQNINFIKFLITIQSNSQYLEVQKVLDQSLNDEVILEYNKFFDSCFDSGSQFPTELPNLNHYGFSN